MPPRITVLGTGYLGATHAACLAELGFDVLGLDTNEAQVATLAAGRLPFHEPELQKLLEASLRSGRLRFSTSYEDAAAFGDVHFVCVGTPQRPDSDAADLSHLMTCIDALAPLLERPCLVVGKSTVPVGTSEIVAERLAQVAPAGAAAEVAWNPAVLREVYAGPLAAGVPFLVTDLPTAELVKTSANAFLATKVSFINAIAEVCEASGADIVPLAQALALDERIGGRFLVPGLGFGGGCLPKDIRAFAASTRDLGVGSVSALLGEVDAINLRRRARMVDLALEMAGGSLEGRTVGVLGCSFKPNSDDIRDSPALDVAGTVHGLGARVTVYDPAALDRARQVHPELEYADSMLAAAADADVLLLLTEWPEFVEADPEVVGKVVARRNIADGRGALDGDRWRGAGWRYRALGRPDTHSSADSISLSG